MDRGNYPKHVEFYPKYKFEKLVQLVGFIIIIYHDARSAERQSGQNTYNMSHSKYFPLFAITL